MYTREDARLRQHFTHTLTALSKRDVSHLPRGTRSRRDRILAMVAAYAERGRFPRNLDHARQTPYFVDARETRCAVAHLLEQNGERDLVELIARTRNNAFVRELQADLAFRAWLASVGLTAGEAARIQPAYCFITKGDVCFCDRVQTPDGVVEGTVTSIAMSTQPTVMVEAVHGDTGGIVVGQSIEAMGTAAVGDQVLVQITAGATTAINLIRIDGTHVELSCAFDVPSLNKADAIEAMLATSCHDAIADVDSIWGESAECSNDDDSCSAGGGASPFVAVFAVALWSARARR